MRPSQPRDQLVIRLFEAWSSGNPDRLEPLFHPDASFFDSVNGHFQGWPAIRALYERSALAWRRIETVPVRIWTDGDTAACVWTMHGEIRGDRYGAELVGSTCRIDGMAWLRFSGDLVIHDDEYFDRAAPSASLAGQGYCPSCAGSRPTEARRRSVLRPPRRRAR